MKYKFDIVGSYPKRKFAVYEKKESFFDKIKKMFSGKKKPKEKRQEKKSEKREV
ncbi:MAG: hypothetical protein ACPL06_01995 [Candidatus Anstonellales archaeon]